MDLKNLAGELHKSTELARITEHIAAAHKTYRKKDD